MRVMKKRRGMWLVAGAVVVSLTVAWWFVVTPSGKSAVTLTFVGYTNRPTVAGGPGKSFPVALISVSNQGTRPVELSAGFPNYAQPTEMIAQLSANEFRVVRLLCSWQTNQSGESLTLEVYMGNPTPSWWTRVQYYEVTMWMQASRRLATLPVPLLRSLLAKAVPRLRMQEATLGPITNPPPALFLQ